MMLQNDKHIHQMNIKTKKHTLQHQVARPFCSDMLATVFENMYSFSLSVLQRIFIHKVQIIHPSETMCNPINTKIWTSTHLVGYLQV